MKNINSHVALKRADPDWAAPMQTANLHMRFLYDQRANVSGWAGKIS